MGTDYVQFGTTMEAPAKLIESGRVTIPTTVRERYGLEKGDYVMIDVRPMEETDD